MAVGLLPKGSTLRVIVVAKKEAPAQCRGFSPLLPTFVARISLHREMVNRGDKKAVKFKSTRIALNTQGGVQHRLVMGFASHRSDG